MLNGWGNFYFLLGSAAAALIGLMFIVTTLTRSMDLEAAMRGQRMFMTPTVFNFATVLAMSATALAPTLTPLAHEIALGVGAACGLFYALLTARHLLMAKDQKPPHWTDPWYYGWLHLILYLALAGSVVATAFARDWGCDAMALCLLLILLLSIRNAWDLVTWMAPRANRLPPE